MRHTNVPCLGFPQVCKTRTLMRPASPGVRLNAGEHSSGCDRRVVHAVVGDGDDTVATVEIEITVATIAAAM